MAIKAKGSANYGPPCILLQYIHGIENWLRVNRAFELLRVKVMLIFLQNMSLLLNKTPPADIRNHVLPMIARALEANQQQIQV